MYLCLNEPGYNYLLLLYREVIGRQSKFILKSTLPRVHETLFDPKTPRASAILDLESALSLMKEGYRGKVNKVWQDFVEKTGNTFNDKPPVEEDQFSYFKYLRKEKKYASSSMLTHYSMLNCVVKNRYGIPLQQFPSVTRT